MVEEDAEAVIADHPERTGLLSTPLREFYPEFFQGNSLTGI
jgi:hypothetical protein